MRKYIRKVFISLTVFSVLAGPSFNGVPLLLDSVRAEEVKPEEIDLDKIFGTISVERAGIVNTFDREYIDKHTTVRGFTTKNNGSLYWKRNKELEGNRFYLPGALNETRGNSEGIVELKLKVQLKGETTYRERDIAVNMNTDYYPTLKTVVGNRDVKQGEFVLLGGTLWQVFGKNYLKTAKPAKQWDSFKNSPNGLFSPNVKGTVGHYLNSDFLDSFDEEEKAYLVKRRWEIKSRSGYLKANPRAYVGMPTFDEAMNYNLPFKFTGSDQMGLISPENSLLLWNETMGFAFERSFNVYATVEVKENTILEGEGTQSNPYRIVSLKDETPSIDPPQNFKALTNDFSLDISWDGKPDHLYTLKSNDTVIYSGKDNSFRYITNSPDTQYKLSLTATSKDLTSAPVEIISKTLPQQNVETPKNLKVTSTKDTLSFLWDKENNAGSYNIKLNGEIKYSGPFKDTPVVIENLAPNTNYSVELIAVGFDKKTESNPTSLVVKTDKDEAAGEVPEKPEKFLAGKVQPYSVTLRWDQSQDADEYVVSRNDGLIVFSGKLTIFRDENVEPNQTYKYQLTAKNKYGHSEKVEYEVTTPEDIKIEPPATPEVGPTTVSFDFREVKGAKGYGIDRNPSWTYKPNGDGTYHVSYVNTVTGEKRDLGNLKTNGSNEIPFSEDGLDPGKNYHYSVVAYLDDGPNGEIVTTEPTEVVITTPINPDSGTGGGTTPDPSTPGTSGGTTPDPSTPGTGGGTTPDPSTPGTGGGTTPDPSTPGTGGGTTPDPSTPGTGGGT
ncbi:hypothetical protein DZB91_24085, partial [Brevibacillus sp. VP]